MSTASTRTRCAGARRFRSGVRRRSVPRGGAGSARGDRGGAAHRRSGARARSGADPLRAGRPPRRPAPRARDRRAVALPLVRPVRRGQVRGGRRAPTPRGHDHRGFPLLSAGPVPGTCLAPWRGPGEPVGTLRRELLQGKHPRHARAARRDLRISVTDRCNFRCVYCMPKEVFGRDYRFLERRELLTFEEIERLARAFVAPGRAEDPAHGRRAARAAGRRAPDRAPGGDRRRRPDADDERLPAPAEGAGAARRRPEARHREPRLARRRGLPRHERRRTSPLRACSRESRRPPRRGSSP